MTNHENADFAVVADGPPATPEPAPRLVISMCGTGTCPTIYRTDHDTVLVQGNVATGIPIPDGEQLVEIPRDLLLEAARQIMAHDAAPVNGSPSAALGL